MEEAVVLIRTLPHIWESREVLMPEVYEGAEYEEALKAAITKALVFFCGKIEALPCRAFGRTPEYVQLGVDFTPKKTAAEMLEEIGQFLQGKSIGRAQ